ncbi:hypothetical protein J4436_04450 [Candidatus Woesearchaeota archaeon]|nr:hypothetical protein [Candidatus Woesearchaeota archaeon]
MKQNKGKKSVAEKIAELGRFLDIPRTAEEIKKEIKDKKGNNIPLQDIRVNLLYLLRREKLKRKKEGNFYRYHN